MSPQAQSSDRGVELHPRPARTTRGFLLFGLLALLGLLMGCAAPGTSPDPSAGPRPDAERGAATWPETRIELTQVPFHPQSRWQCGPAALATVLGASGHMVDPDDLVEQVWIPERRGALAVELLAATRRSGRLAYGIEPQFGALLAELQAGRPVLVMQNLGFAWLPAWHFAVVIGFDPQTDTVILRSGTEARRTTPLARFDRSWARAERWAMVALQPGELPARVDRNRLLAAAAAVERVDQAALAHATYRRWLEQAPADAAARFGLGSTAHTLGDRETAVRAYRSLLEERPDDVRTLNNLARVLHEEGDSRAATQMLEQALTLTEDQAVRAVLQASLDAVREERVDRSE